MQVEHDDDPGVSTGEVEEAHGDLAAPEAVPPAADEIERRLRESEERYHALVAAAAQIVWSTPPDGLVDDLPLWRAYTGQSVAQVKGWGWLDAVHPDDRERTSMAWSRAVATRSLYETEYRLRHHDGTYCLFLVRGVPVVAADGSIREWLGVCTDITERKRAEEERAAALAREQEARAEAERARAEAEAQVRQLDATFESVGDGVFVFGRDGQVLHMNSAARHLLAMDASDTFYAAPLQERGYTSVVHDEYDRSLPEMRWPLFRVLRGEVLTGAGAVDLIVRRADGQERELNVSGTPVRDQDGHVTGAVCVVRDVTERRRLERRTQDALDALLTMAGVLVGGPSSLPATAAPLPDAGIGAETRLVGRQLADLTRDVLSCQHVAILSLEPETERLHPVAIAGFSPADEPLWWRQWDAHPHLRDRLDAVHIARLYADDALILDRTQPPFSGETAFGRRIVLMVPLRVGHTLSGVLSADHGEDEHVYTPDEIVLVRAVGRLAALVIERERLLRDREEARANELALREANRRMDEFMSVASHEMRTPLTTISGSIQLAGRRLKRLEEHEEVRASALAGTLKGTQQLLSRADAQLSRLTRLVYDLLDVSRIASGQLSLRPEPSDLATLVREIVEEHRQVAPSRAVLLEPPPAAPVPVVADRDRIAQVLTNYLSNALKYAPPDRPITVGVQVDERRARVYVRDEGPGVPPDEQHHIWHRYYQIEGVEPQSGSNVGLGLGLHISRSIVEQHGGAVGVASMPGEGALFWFTLPLAT